VIDYRLEDEETGHAPVLGAGDQLHMTITLVDGVMKLPETRNVYGMPVIKCRVVRA
jgi:hypothetical protein